MFLTNEEFCLDAISYEIHVLREGSKMFEVFKKKKFKKQTTFIEKQPLCLKYKDKW